MTLNGENILSGAHYLLPFVWLTAVNLFVSRKPNLSLRSRWLGACAAAASPALLPSPAEHTFFWPIAATIITTLAVVSSCRFADLANFRSSKRASTPLEVFLWMTLPMVQNFASTPDERAECRAATKRWIRMALLKASLCLPLILFVQFVDGSDVVWPLKSAVLMLYFVLNLTCVSDSVCALCSQFGIQVEGLFAAPLRSTSPRDFWSRRWNKYISRFALKYVALPLRGTLPRSLIILSVFATSGIFHEYFAWGVGGEEARHGPMLCFFLIQGLAVEVGTRFPLKLPRWAGVSLTFAWMALSAPLFFHAIEPALSGFGYPTDWLPQPAWLFELSRRHPST